jgi:hypothetical protein
MGRKKQIKKKGKGIYMVIGPTLYRKSKAIIENRTKDYENYLARKIHTNNRAEMIKLEIEELDQKREALMKEYDIEIGIEANEDHMEDETINKITYATNTIMKIVNNQGGIGWDKIEEIADFQGISLAELKLHLPESIKDKIVEHNVTLETVEGRSDYGLSR